MTTDEILDGPGVSRGRGHQTRKEMASVEESTAHEDHLTVVMSDRGFSRLPAIPSEYGGDVRVYESSAAMHPCIWLTATAPVDLNNPTGPMVQAPMHLTVENAQKLAEQILLLVADHYQGGAS